MHIIQVLGTGCRRCNELYASAQQAAAASGVECRVEKVTDIVKMLDFNVMALPALVIDGKVVTMGTVMTPSEIGHHLSSS